MHDRVLPALPEEGSIVRATLRALLIPKRLVPVILVSATLIFAQRAYSRDPRAGFVGAALCLAFVLVAPVSFRVLFPEGLEFRHGAVRLLLYFAIATFTVHVVGVYLPMFLAGIRSTFLTAPTSVPIDVALFLAGGWGLGRDIGFEASLDRERKRAIILAREAEHAQLLALRAQLDPHFLFNTLNAIAEWCRTDGETAERAVLELAQLLRAILTGVKQPSWPLSRELALIETIFALHLRRDPEMFTLELDVASDVGAILVPPLLLVPLAENAVKHGPASGHRGVVTIVATLVDDTHVRVTISNPGEYGGPREGSHGVPTTERRLSLSYEGRASFAMRGEGKRTIASVDLPRSGPTVTT